MRPLIELVGFLAEFIVEYDVMRYFPAKTILLNYELELILLELKKNTMVISPMGSE